MAVRSPVWLVPPVSSAERASAATIRNLVFSQTWLPAGPEPGFQDSSACVTWEPSGLTFGIEMMGAGATNRARQLNEPTWELGDVAEVFIGVRERPDYFEFHVTPENQRLQLHFPADGVARLRAGQAKLSEFAFDRPGVESRTQRNVGSWSVSLKISPAVLGLAEFQAGQVFDIALCRYDYGGKAAPVFSSTAQLTAPNFHRRHEWQQLRLAP